MLSVVVVDDCKSILDVLVDCLVDIAGVDTIISGSTLNDVLPVVSALSQDKTVLLIVDYHLGGECGLDVVQSLRQTRNDQPAVIIMTGDDDKELTEKLEQTSYRLMRKPFSFDVLATEINSVLDRERVSSVQLQA